ncbi:TPA: tetratricopeptide repeat protein [Klebsiella variicola]|nr:tetratricopeptide repeat protein [Klebsiella variicola]HDK6447851.1 tetratricopeptide repeat protein [Klebsiella variicola]
MGFGKKTDFRSGKLLNLDATYNEIIKPAAEELSIKCIRADEIMQSGIIDVEMYKLLLSADIVVADISTSNANAIYELGVRHALKKGTTIIMSEKSAVLHFDLNHIATLRYEHLGDDIGCSEARRIKEQLKSLMEAALNETRIDSPVYTYLPDLNTPTLTAKEIKEIVRDSDEVEKEWGGIFNSAEEKLKLGDFSEAKELYQKALEIRPRDEYLIQRLTLCTYKEKTESKSRVMCCMDAMVILAALSPDTSNDPETTGMAGAINKYIWMDTKDITFLNKAISFYNRGYTIKKDYYNGENLALCHFEKAKQLRNTENANNKDIVFNEVSAERIFSSVLEITEGIIESTNFDERSDVKWVYATAAKAASYLELKEKEDLYSEKFKLLCDNSWDFDTFEENKIKRS